MFPSEIYNAENTAARDGILVY